MKSRTLNLIAVIAIAVTGIASSRTQSSAVYYIYVLKARNPAVAQTGPRPEDAPVVQAHVKYLRSLIEKGVCVVSGSVVPTGHAPCVERMAFLCFGDYWRGAPSDIPSISNCT